MQQLKGFQYAITLDINMGYYNIRLPPTIQETTRIVTELGKFRRNSIPMGMCALGDIFQVKVYKLLGDIEGVKTYINDILVFRKYFFTNHI